jgi:hypothetical protein
MKMANSNARGLLPKDDVWFWNRRMGGEERGDGMGVSGRDSGEKGRRMEGTGVEEVGRFCGSQDVSNHKSRCKEWREI